MRHTHVCAAAAALCLAVAGCQSGSRALPPGEDGTRAGGDGTFGSNVTQPGEGNQRTNGTGLNDGTLPENAPR